VVLEARDLRTIERGCLRSFEPEFRLPPATVVVRRTGTLGESLTFTDAEHDVVLGCAGTGSASTPVPRWCGRSVGRLYAGRLRDVRLDVACHDRAGRPVGFGWIEPGPATRWIGVRAGGRVAEVAAVAAGLPVRVATDAVDRARSSATFAVAEYAASGAAVRSFRVRAGVAG
jgi:hypothetical protein